MTQIGFAATRPDVNRRLDHLSCQRTHAAARRSSDELDDRIMDLGREWDFERVVEVEASLTGLLGIALGTLADSRFLFMPGMAAGMLLVHALHGWYPLLPPLRRLGIRSQDEIDREFYALKALRGDFDKVDHAEADARAELAWNAVMR